MGVNKIKDALGWISFESLKNRSEAKQAMSEFKSKTQNLERDLESYNQYLVDFNSQQYIKIPIGLVTYQEGMISLLSLESEKSLMSGLHKILHSVNLV